VCNCEMGGVKKSKPSAEGTVEPAPHDTRRIDAARSEALNNDNVREVIGNHLDNKLLSRVARVDTNFASTVNNARTDQALVFVKDMAYLYLLRDVCSIVQQLHFCQPLLMQNLQLYGFTALQYVIAPPENPTDEDMRPGVGGNWQDNAASFLEEGGVEVVVKRAIKILFDISLYIYKYTLRRVCACARVCAVCSLALQDESEWEGSASLCRVLVAWRGGLLLVEEKMGVLYCVFSTADADENVCRCVCMCVNTQRHTHTTHGVCDVSPGVGTRHLEGPKNPLADGLNLGTYVFVYVYKVQLELHYVLQVFCVRQEDGGGVNRGS